MMDTPRYIVVGANGKTAPPITWTELHDRAAAGQITPGTRIIDTQANEPFLAGQHPALRVVFARQHASIAPPPQSRTAPRAGVLPATLPDPLSNYEFGSLTRHYENLVLWQALSVIALLTLPMDALFLLSLLAYSILSGGVSTIVWIILAMGPIIATIRILYVISTKATLRRRIAEMGIDSATWGAALDRRLWPIVGIGTAIIAAITGIMWIIVFLLVSQYPDSPHPDNTRREIPSQRYYRRDDSGAPGGMPDLPPPPETHR